MYKAMVLLRKKKRVMTGITLTSKYGKKKKKSSIITPLFIYLITTATQFYLAQYSKVD